MGDFKTNSIYLWQQIVPTSKEVADTGLLTQPIRSQQPIPPPKNTREYEKIEREEFSQMYSPINYSTPNRRDRNQGRGQRSRGGQMRNQQHMPQQIAVYNKFQPLWDYHDVNYGPPPYVLFREGEWSSKERSGISTMQRETPCVFPNRTSAKITTVESIAQMGEGLWTTVHSKERRV